MTFVAFRDLHGRFRVRVPAAWLIEHHPSGATLFRDHRWNEQVSVSVSPLSARARPVTGLVWRRLREFASVRHHHDGVSFETWNGVHGEHLIVVTHTMCMDATSFPREHIGLVLNTLEFSSRRALPQAPAYHVVQ